MAEATKQKMDEIVKKTIDAVMGRTERKKAILKNIPSKYILNTYPIDEKAIKKDSDYEFLILESEWSGYKFSRWPSNSNRFIKIKSEQNEFCFYMRTGNPTTLKPDTKTSNKYTESLNDLLEITGFNENWIIIPKEYTQDVLEENERVKQNEQAKTSQDIKQELMEKFGLSEEEIAQDIFYKQQEFKNMISVDAAIQLVLKEHQAKKIPSGQYDDDPDTFIDAYPEEKKPIAFDFQDEPDNEEKPKKEESNLVVDEKSFQVQHKPIQGSLEVAKDTIRNYLCKNATNEELGLFVHFCKVNGLDPFKKEAYIIKPNGQDAYFIVSKDVFNKRATNQPDFGGFEAGIIILQEKEMIKREGTILLEGETLLGGYCKVYRKDKREFYAEASFKEFEQYRKDGQPNRFWREKPSLMIRKVAFAHALREAYPNELAGLYLSEELPQLEN